MRTRSFGSLLVSARDVLAFPFAVAAVHQSYRHQVPGNEVAQDVLVDCNGPAFVEPNQASVQLEQLRNRQFGDCIGQSVEVLRTAPDSYASYSVEIHSRDSSEPVNVVGTTANNG